MIKFNKDVYLSHVKSSFLLDIENLENKKFRILYDKKFITLNKITESRYEVQTLNFGVTFIDIQREDKKISKSKIIIRNTQNGRLGLFVTRLLLGKGKKFLLLADSIFENLEYSSRDKEIVEVDNNGFIHAINYGETYIDVESNGIKQSCFIKVTNELKNKLTFFDLQPYDNDYINWYGRIGLNNICDGNKKIINGLRFNNATSGFEISFFGKQLNACFFQNTNQKHFGIGYNNNYLSVFADEVADSQSKILEISGNREYNVYNFEDAKYHTIKILNRSEEEFSHISLINLSVDGYFCFAPDKLERKIEIYGDSITNGYGNLSKSVDDVHSNKNSNALQSFAFLSAQNLNSQLNIVAYSGWGLYTSKWSNFVIPDVYDKIDDSDDQKWDFQNYKPDIIVISLGTNDYGNRKKENEKMPLFTKEDFQKAYKDFIKKLNYVYKKNMKIVCVYGIMNNSNRIDSAIKDMISELNREGIKEVYYYNMYSIDNTVIGEHPSTLAHRDMSIRFTNYIKNLMNW